jgi:O-antigen ligase
VLTNLRLGRFNDDVSTSFLILSFVGYSSAAVLQLVFDDNFLKFSDLMYCFEYFLFFIFLFFQFFFKRYKYIYIDKVIILLLLLLFLFISKLTVLYFLSGDIFFLLQTLKIVTFTLIPISVFLFSDTKKLGSNVIGLIIYIISLITCSFILTGHDYYLKILEYYPVMHRLGFLELNPISLAICASYLVIIPAFFLTHRIFQKLFILHIISIILGIIVIAMTGTKGVLLSIIPLIIIICRGFSRKIFTLFSILFLIAFILINTEYFPVGDFYHGNYDSSIDQSNLERFDSIKRSFNQFLQNPLLGGANEKNDLLFYPHNIFLESASFLGILGPLIIIILHVSAFKSVIKRNRPILLDIFFIQQFLYSFTYGSFVESNLFWILLYIVIERKKVNSVVNI